MDEQGPRLLYMLSWDPGAGVQPPGQELRGVYKVHSLVVKAPAAKARDLNFIPWTHMAEGKNCLLQLSYDFHTCMPY